MMKRSLRPGGALALGIAIGTASGVAMNNIGLGLALGVCIGAALETRSAQRRSRSEEPAGEDGDPGARGATGGKPPISSDNGPD